MVNFINLLLTSGAFNTYYSYLLFSVVIIVGYQALRRGRIAVNVLRLPAFWVLLLWGITYTLIGTRDPSSLLRHVAVPVLALFAGWVIYEDSGLDRDKALRRMLLAMVGGFLIHAALNYSINIGLRRWQIRDYYTRELVSATCAGGINTFGLSLIGCWLLVEKKWYKKILGLAATIPFLLYSLQLGTRTQIIILVTVFIVTMLVYMVETKGRKAGFNIVLLLAVLIGIGYIVYTQNLFGIGKMIDESELMLHFKNDSQGQHEADSYRFNAVWEGIVSLLDHPMGLREERRYFHNMWLDVGRIGGIIPFALMLAFTLILTVHTLKMLRRKHFDIRTRYMLSAVVLGILINFLVEPVIEGLPDLWLAFCMLSGMVEAMVYYDGMALPDVRQKKLVFKWG